MPRPPQSLQSPGPLVQDGANSSVILEDVAVHRLLRVRRQLTDFVSEKCIRAQKDNNEKKEVEMDVLKAVWMAEDFGKRAQEPAFVTQKVASPPNFEVLIAELEASKGTSATAELRRKVIYPLHHEEDSSSGHYGTPENKPSMLSQGTNGRDSIRKETAATATKREDLEKLRFSGSAGQTKTSTLMQGENYSTMKQKFQANAQSRTETSPKEASPSSKEKSASRGISAAWRAQSKSSGLVTNASPETKTRGDEIPVVLKKRNTDGKVLLKSPNPKVPSHIANERREAPATHRVDDKSLEGVLNPTSPADFLTLEKRAQSDLPKSAAIALRTRDSVRKIRFEEKLKEESRVSPSKALLEQLYRHKEIRSLSESDRKVVENIFLLRMAVRHLLRLSLLTENPKVITSMFRALKKKLK
mmetsp:Transcript_2197/g.4811  ORF Transcript_2197/g.4811 Transcript_2197/m.4811 type:complete len:415 (-) Transcript_2197:155-1399(-)